jgi:DegT/DnrJ/EryC1/StrS aminotransferase family
VLRGRLGIGVFSPPLDLVGNSVGAAARECAGAARDAEGAVYHMLAVRAERREELAQHLQSRGVCTGIHYPVAHHQQPAITKLYNDLPSLPRTEKAVQEILSMAGHRRAMFGWCIPGASRDERLCFIAWWRLRR